MLKLLELYIMKLQNMNKIPFNTVVFKILYWDLWNGWLDDIDESEFYCFETFSELFPDKELTSDEKYDIIKDFLSKNIKVLDEITNYTDLEKGYSEETLIIKYNGVIYGIPFWTSPYAGTECDDNKEFIEDFDEYEEVQVTTYQPK